MAGCDLGIAAHRAADVDGDDVGALLGEPDRVTAALPARRSGDESDLALDSSRHGHLAVGRRPKRPGYRLRI